MPNPERFCRPASESACPQGCAYCIVDLNEGRKGDYDEGLVYFMNSFVAINLPLKNRDRHLKMLYDFDFYQMAGDVIGFQGASEPMMFPTEMRYVCEQARKYNFKVAICTKATITESMAERLFEEYGDVLRVEVSYAKLPELERTDSTRLKTIENLIKAGFEPLVVVQPFIFGLTDIRFEELLSEMVAVGVRNICLNGFRYSKAMDSWANKVIPSEWLAQYRKHEGEEWLPDREELKTSVIKKGLTYMKIGEWLRKLDNGGGTGEVSTERVEEQMTIVRKMIGLPDQTLRSWKITDGELMIEGGDLDSYDLRVASDSNAECIMKMLSRRLRVKVRIG